MPKNVNKIKKPDQILIRQQIPKFKKISIRFKIGISQLIAKILLKQRRLKQIRHSLIGHNKI